ncbi:OadG family protein [Chloroflexus sp.]|uniref:OadG family protein n=1 Tax=Chloroflexus sp. TaxID=1904827 RepID=UPI00298F32EF|nr:OadG family protein [Chloroflexus sp.]MDW8405181.1 OadG family protein [Chloroflexus sp.]
MIDLTADPLVVSLQITITGLAIVFIVLGIVAAMLGALSASQRWLRPQAVTPPTPASEPIARSPATTDQLDPQLIAILTAAAVATLNQPVRVLRVRYYRQPSAMWTRFGRVSVMASRQLRR